MSPVSFAAIECGQVESYREHPIHVLRLDGVTHLIDVEALGPYGMGYADTSSAVFRIPAAFKRRFTAQDLDRYLGGFRTFHHVYWLVSEPGLEFLARKSHLANAKPFLDWAKTTIFDRDRVPQVEETTPPTEVHVMPQDDPDKTDVFDDDFPPPDDDDEENEATDDSTTDVEEEEEYGKERSDYPEIQVQTIPFYGKNGLQAGWHDGDIWVNFRRCCEDLRLRYSAQYMRIKRQVWGRVLVMRTRNERGHLVPMGFITRKVLGMWLATLQVSRCAEPARPTLTRFQLEAMDVIEKHFFPRPQPTGQSSLDMEALAKLVGLAVGQATKAVVPQAVKEAMGPILDRIRNIEDMFLAAESKRGGVNIDALYDGRWMSLREWADEHRYVVDSEQAMDWGMHMRNVWVFLGLRIERRIARNGKGTNVYPATAIQRLFNVTCPREVWIDRRSGDGSAHRAELPFRNGHQFT
jgi:hypothetical protein